MKKAKLFIVLTSIHCSVCKVLNVCRVAVELQIKGHQDPCSPHRIMSPCNSFDFSACLELRCDKRFARDSTFKSVKLGSH